MLTDVFVTLPALNLKCGRNPRVSKKLFAQAHASVLGTNEFFNSFLLTRGLLPYLRTAQADFDFAKSDYVAFL